MARALLCAALLLAVAGSVPAQAAKRAKRSATPSAYGAIAYHRATQSWGVSHDFPRLRDAIVEALKQCGNSKCEMVHKFKNGCAALADGPKIHAAESGATRAEAETKALRRCAELNQADCSPVAWACTR